MINDDQWVSMSYHRLTLCSMWMFVGCCSCHTRCWELSQRRMGLHSLRAGHSCTGSTWYCLLIIIMIRIKKIFINDNYSPSLTTKRKQKIVDKNLFMVSYCWYCWIMLYLLWVMSNECKMYFVRMRVSTTGLSGSLLCPTLASGWSQLWCVSGRWLCAGSW